MNKKATKNIVYLIILSMILIITLVLIAAFNKRSENRENYDYANKCIDLGNYEKAYSILAKLDDYKDTQELIKKAKRGMIYNEAIELLEKKDYENAIKKFESIKNFKDSEELVKQAKYDFAIEYYTKKDYDKAKQLFLELDGFENSEEYIDEIEKETVVNLTSNIYQKACKSLENEDYKKALDYFNSIIDYKDCKEKAKYCEDRLRKELSHTISACSNYFLGITDTNRVKFSGLNDYMQGNVGSWKNIVSIDGYSECTMGLKDDGTISIAGKLNKEDKKYMENLKHVIDISAGEKYVVALKSNGKVFAKGHDGNGQCEVDNWENIIDIDCGWSFTVGLDNKGNLHFAGKYNEKGKNYSPKKDDWKDVIKISASGGDPLKHRGGGHVVGLKENGRVIAIGDNDFGQCNIEQWKDIVAIAAGDWYTVGLTSKGKIKITGENNPNGIKHTFYKNDEIMNEWKKMNIKDIAAGYGITLVLNEKGKLDVMGFVNKEQRDKIKDWQIKLKD